MLFQRLWERGMGWDDNLPNDLQGDWDKWTKELGLVSELRISRWYFNVMSEIPKEIVLDVFCDASQDAYGAIAYTRSKSEINQVSVKIIASKTRATPLIRKIIVAEVRVNGLFACSKTSKIHHHNARLVQTCFWTDLTLALGWVKGAAHRWKAFVANRIQEILGENEARKLEVCAGIG